MTSKIEQEFYDIFGIEPLSNWHKCKDYCCTCCNEYEFCSRREFIYPRITAEKLLEMICIINEFISMFNWKQIKYISTFEIETLKENILKDLIWISSNECNDVTREQLKFEIQQLFKEISE